VTIDPAANDTDPDGDTLTVTAITNPTHGAATLNGNGTVTYTPANDYSGTDAFTYTVSDGHGGTDIGTVTITVQGVAASVAPASPTYGQQVTFAARLNPFPSSGTVAFRIDQGAGWQTACTANIPATAPSDQAVRCTYPPTGGLGVGQAELRPGQVALQATYTSSDSFQATSASFTFTVQPEPTTTAVAPIAPTSAGGQTTLTASVTPDIAGTQLSPTGSVTFHIGTASGPAVGTAAVQPDGTATVQLTVAVPGEPIVAVYGGDSNFTASTSTAATVPAACSTTLTGTRASVVVASGTTCLDGTHISGSLVVTGPGAVVITNSTVTGSIIDNGGGSLVVCGSHVDNSVIAQNAKGIVVIGDPTLGCTGNTVDGSITAVSNHHGVAIVANTYGRAVTAAANSGGVTPTDPNPVIGPNAKQA
jgi:hypothetical protein